MQCIPSYPYVNKRDDTETNVSVSLAAVAAAACASAGALEEPVALEVRIDDGEDGFALLEG